MSRMNEIYLKELNTYSKEYLLTLMNEESFERLIEYEVIKREEDNFKFHFVGLIIVDNYLIKCYPKYIPDENNIAEDFNQIMQVIKKYRNFHEDYIWRSDNLDEITFNKLSILLFFIEDYYENGIYTNFRQIHQVNGNGEINWDKTVNNIDPIIKNNRPYYGELYTKYNLNDLSDYFRLLHEYIITECSKQLEDVGLIDLFDLTPAELSDKSLDDFGEEYYILNKIENEINMEFNSHKQKLLKAMHTFISQKNSFTNENVLTIYGTTAYHEIWEEMCCEIFSNKFNKIKHVIEKPKWILNNGKTHYHKKTFEPDIVTFKGDTLFILDAKYYNLIFNEDLLANQPGLGDITKQYLYQLALEDYGEGKFDNVKNALLFPKYCGEIENLGQIEIEILSRLPVDNIQVVMLPAGKINRLYLNNQKLDINELKLNKN